jgi:hypothetical protein
MRTRQFTLTRSARSVGVHCQSMPAATRAGGARLDPPPWRIYPVGYISRARPFSLVPRRAPAAGLRARRRPEGDTSPPLLDARRPAAGAVTPDVAELDNARGVWYSWITGKDRHGREKGKRDTNREGANRARSTRSPRGRRGRARLHEPIRRDGARDDDQGSQSRKGRQSNLHPPSHHPARSQCAVSNPPTKGNTGSEGNSELCRPPRSAARKQAEPEGRATSPRRPTRSTGARQPTHPGSPTRSEGATP